MGSAFSVGIYCKTHPVPGVWEGTLEDYEALKTIMYERMGDSKELYQLLLGLRNILSGNCGKVQREMFVDFGYADLLVEVLKRKYLNKDIVVIACKNLTYLAPSAEDNPTFVHSLRLLKVLSELLPSLVQRDSRYAAVSCIKHFSPQYRGEGDADVSFLYRQLFGIIRIYKGDLDMYAVALETIVRLLNVGEVADTVPKFVALNGVEEVRNLFSKYRDSSGVFINCSLLFVALCNRSREGVRDILQMGCLELVIGSLFNVPYPEATTSGLTAIAAICSRDSSAPARALNQGVMEKFKSFMGFGIIGKPHAKLIAFCLEALFCFDAMLKSQWHADAVALMKKIRRQFPDSERIKKVANSFNRVEDPEARKCREANKCTRAGIGDCIKHPGSQQCKKCYVPQFFFHCSTCEGAYSKVFCLACKERCHKGHKGETFFTIGRCDCENEYCLHPPGELTSEI